MMHRFTPNLPALLVLAACGAEPPAAGDRAAANGLELAEDLGERAPDPFFAISADQPSFLGDEPRVLRALGAGMVRLEVQDWPANRARTEAEVDAARAAGLAVYLQIDAATVGGDAAEWHAGFDDAGNAFSARYVATAVDLASTFRGRVRAYEIWNEPNAAPLGFGPLAEDGSNADWDGACTDYVYGAYPGGSPWAICPRLLGVLAVNAFMAIEATDPGALVVAGNVLAHGAGAWVAHDYWREVERSPAVAWYRANRGGDPWNVVGFHPYAYSPLDGGLQEQIGRLRDVQRAHGDAAPIALSEYGWHTDSDGGDDYQRTTLAEQADLVRDTFRVAREERLAFVVWFNYLDWDEGHYGLREIADGRNSTPGNWKPSGRAFCEAAGARSCPAP